MNFKQLISFFSLLYLFELNVQAQKTLTISFYNVENLFDTINNQYKDDEDFLPDGKNKWNSEKYRSKISHLAKVISELGNGNGPDVIGLAEIENKLVLQDLVFDKQIKTLGYQIVHYESPDERGIDVALLFKKKIFKLAESKAFKIAFTFDEKDKTRDILFTKLIFKKDTLAFLVNHFPSRLGGIEKSEPYRVFVAERLRFIYDSLLNKNYRLPITIMGDFNDEPENKSISQTMKCHFNNEGLSWNDIYNPMMDLKKEGKGTIVYKKEFELIDQFMLSSNLTEEKNNFYYIKNSTEIFSPEWLKEQEEPYKGNPFRTFGGKKWLNGYSDHFPIQMKIKIK